MDAPAPSKVIGVHVNYRSRAEQRGRTPDVPSYFFKPPSSVAARRRPGRPPARHGAAHVRGRDRGRRSAGARGASRPARGLEHIGWFAPANDFGLYDFRWADRGSNVLAKGHDGFTPIGHAAFPPPRSTPTRSTLRTRVNGELVQEDSTANLIFPFGLLVADLSRFITLEPGDVILTGTPAGSRPVEPGDVVEVELDGRRPRAQHDRRGAPADRGVRRAAEGVARRPRGRARRQRAAPGHALRGGEGGAAQRLDGDADDRSSGGTGSGTRSCGGLRPTRPDLRLLGYAYTLRYVPAARGRPGRRAGRPERAEAGDRVDRARGGARDRRPAGGRRRHDRRHPRRAGARPRRSRDRHRRRPPRQPGRLRRSRSRPTTRRRTRPSSGSLHYPLETNVPIACAGTLVSPAT